MDVEGFFYICFVINSTADLQEFWKDFKAKLH